MMAEETPTPQDHVLNDLATIEEPLLRRYSRHGEFPWSLTLSILVHLCLILVIIFMAKAATKKDPTPPTVDVVEVGEEENAASGMGDAPPDDEGKLEEANSEQAPPTPPTPPSTALTDVDQTKPPIDVTLPPVDEGTQAAENQAQDVRDRLDRAAEKRRQLSESFAKHNASGSGGSGTGGGGGGGGTGATGRGARPARWILRFNTFSPTQYLSQLDGLGAAVAFPLQGDKWRYFYDVSSSNRRTEVRDLASETRLYWMDNKLDSVRGVAAILGVTDPPFMVVFLPQELEDRMLKLELAYKGLKEEEIRSTQFECVSRGGKLDVIVVGQTAR